MRSLLSERRYWSDVDALLDGTWAGWLEPAVSVALLIHLEALEPGTIDQIVLLASSPLASIVAQSVEAGLLY